MYTFVAFRYLCIYTYVYIPRTREVELHMHYGDIDIRGYLTFILAFIYSYSYYKRSTIYNVDTICF